MANQDSASKEAKHQLRYAGASASTAKDYVEDLNGNEEYKEKAKQEIDESKEHISEAIETLNGNTELKTGGIYKKGGITNMEKVNEHITILKQSLQSNATPSEHKEDMKLQLEILESEFVSLKEQKAEANKVDRNITIPDDKKFWIKIDREYLPSVRSSLMQLNIPHTLRTIKGKMHVLVPDRETSKRVFNIYNLRRVKKKDSPADEEEVTGKFNKGGKLWIAKAVENEGALRNKAKRMGLLRHDEENLSETDLKKIEKESPKDKKRVNLARTLKKLN